MAVEGLVQPPTKQYYPFIVSFFRFLQHTKKGEAIL